MVVLDVTCVLPRTRRRPAGAAHPAARGAAVRAATVSDVERTAALELAGAPLVLRLFPALVRWQHRWAVRQPGSVALVWERRGPSGRVEVAGFLVGTRRGVVDLLVTDDGSDAEDGADVLVAAFRRRCAGQRPRGDGRVRPAA